MKKPILVQEVAHDRWREAQRWEEAHWIRTQQFRAKYGKNWIWRVLRMFGLVEKYRGDDWNLWWKERFDHYSFLPKRVGNAIEVGCGPYTNMRHILPVCVADHLFLSDPLIRTYIAFKLAFTADAYRSGFAILDDHPLEEIPYRAGYFDLVVMINVLDHVRDAALCMENATAMTKPGGWLILGQDLTNEEDYEALAADPGLVGHPIKLSHEWFEPWLRPKFQPILDRRLSREEGRDPNNHYGTLLFAGIKQ